MVAVAQSAEGPAVDPDAKARVTLAVGLLFTGQGSGRVSQTPWTATMRRRAVPSRSRRASR